MLFEKDWFLLLTVAVIAIGAHSLLNLLMAESSRKTICKKVLSATALSTECFGVILYFIRLFLGDGSSPGGCYSLLALLLLIRLGERFPTNTPRKKTVVALYYTILLLIAVLISILEVTIR